MPTREEEYWAARREPGGEALCPFCGSRKVYYNERYKVWRCGKCEKSFPSPSYGPGGKPQAKRKSSWWRRLLGKD